MTDQILAPVERNQILEDAEKRAGARSVHDQVAEALVAAMRNEVRPDVDTAKAVLPDLQAAINKTFRPFVARVVNMAQRRNATVPDQVRGWLTEMDKLSQDTPQQITYGLQMVQDLTFHAVSGIGRDGKPGVDANKRTEWIATVRQFLRLHDGVLSRLASLKGQTEFFIKESGWPQ
jgi:hypothetical protein